MIEPTDEYGYPLGTVHAPYVTAGIVVVEYLAERRTDHVDVSDLGEIGARP